MHAAALGLAAGGAIAALTWAVSVPRRDVSIVDSVWSVLVLAPACVVCGRAAADRPARAWSCCCWPRFGPCAWPLYITWRHWGHDEDHRYREIRARNEPHFAWKSLYLVFGLQALLAWVVVDAAHRCRGR